MHAAEIDMSASETLWCAAQVAGRRPETAHLTTAQIARAILAQEGLKGFWRGAVPRVMNVALWGTCMVTTYEVLKRLCLLDDDDTTSDASK
jgi:solute carrier family 25 protein 44